MARFLFVFRGGGYASKSTDASPAALQAHLERWKAWTDGMVAAGQLVTAVQLPYPPSGKTVKGRDRVVHDGPWAEAKDLISGTLVVNAETLDAAATLAQGCPILEMDGSVEVRQLA